MYVVAGNHLFNVIYCSACHTCLYVKNVQAPTSIGLCMEKLRCLLIFTSPAGAVPKYCDEHVCLSVCLSTRISPEPHARSSTIFLVHVGPPLAE